MHLQQAMIERDWRSTWRWSIWRRLMGGVPAAESLFIGLLTRICGNVMRWLYLWSSYGELAGGGQSGGKYAGRWSYIQGSTRNIENEGTTDNPSCMQQSVYAAFGVCCTRCMLHSVYAALGVCCTRSMLHSVYAALGVCCTRCMLHSVLTYDDGRDVDKEERAGGWRRRQYGGYEQIWEIRRTTCLIGVKRPHIGVITHQIRTRNCRTGTRTCNIGDGKLTRTRNSLSPSFSSWFLPSNLVSLFLVLNSTIT